MNTLEHIQHQVDTHKERAFDLLRIYLGLGLFIRGVLFIADSSAYAELISGSSTPTFESAALMHYVALAHIGGGILLALGLLTRLAALIQIPILAGAVFFVHLPEGLTSADQSLEFAALVLVLLVLVFVYGSGKWSVDYYLLTQEEPEVALAGSRREAVPDRDRQAQRRAQPARRSAPALETSAAPAACSCGHDLHHPDVREEGRFGLWGMLHFAAGITGEPKEIVHRCRSCNEVIERSRDPEQLRTYRHRRAAPGEPAHENSGAV